MLYTKVFRMYRKGAKRYNFKGREQPKTTTPSLTKKPPNLTLFPVLRVLHHEVLGHMIELYIHFLYRYVAFRLAKCVGFLWVLYS